jgi:putative DNA primase/helicase
MDDLHRSGLSDDQINRCRFYSLQTTESVQKVLRWRRYDGKLGNCLAIPFVTANGEDSGYCRLKPDWPRKSKEDGKPIKYESPKGSNNRAYFPPDTLAVLHDPSKPLLITEGEKKSAKADQEGFPCIGLVGAHGWQRKRRRDEKGEPQGDRELVEDLATLPWQARTVYLCFDSDAATNPNVRRGEWHLAETLARKGAIVAIVRLPQGNPGPDGISAKIGLDDFLVAHGPNGLNGLLAKAEEPTPPLGLAPIEATDDPHRLARLFIGETCTHRDGLMLRYYREQWHKWDGSAYRIVGEKELRAELTRSAKAEMDRLNLIAQKLAAINDKPPPSVRKITGRLIGDVGHALASLTMLPSRLEAPAWLDGNGRFPATEILGCRNGLVHLASLVSDKDFFLPCSPRLFSPNCLDFDFDLSAPRPAAWLDFLDRLWPDDPQSIGTLQEWFGYVLTPDTRLQKILLLVGPRRSGKGTIARVNRGMVGAENVAGPTLSSLGTNFGLWPLLGKTVAMIQDARLSGRTDAATVTERLLSISGEDALTIDRKNLSPVTAKLTARFMILTNELPRLNDPSGALAGRMILLRLMRSWYGKEDIGLTDRLLGELPGILLWAISGWQRLRERGHFIQPDAGKELVGDLEDLSSPMGAFVRECCDLGPEFRATVADLFGRWKSWCDAKGRKEPGTEQTFGRDLLAAVPTLQRVRARDGDERYRCYDGIGLRSS